jgi:hypothetical protein
MSGTSVIRGPEHQNGDPPIDERVEEEEDEEDEEDEEEDDEEEEIDEYDLLTQKLNHDTNKEQYDPSQDKSERRTIRQRYRELIQTAEGIFTLNICMRETCHKLLSNLQL